MTNPSQRKQLVRAIFDRAVELAPADPWRAGALPARRPPRPLPPAAVLKRLGRSGIRVEGVELADALAPAYAAFAATSSDTP